MILAVQQNKGMLLRILQLSFLFQVGFLFYILGEDGNDLNATLLRRKKDTSVTGFTKSLGEYHNTVIVPRLKGAHPVYWGATIFAWIKDMQGDLHITRVKE